MTYLRDLWLMPLFHLYRLPPPATQPDFGPLPVPHFPHRDRCHGGLQRDRLLVRPDRLWQDPHDDGQRRRTGDHPSGHPGHFRAHPRGPEQGIPIKDILPRDLQRVLERPSLA